MTGDHYQELARNKVKYCFLGDLEQFGTGRVFRDHCGIVLGEFSKLAGEGITVEVEIQVLLECLLQVKDLRYLESFLWCPRGK